jgi:hypothetical protein
MDFELVVMMDGLKVGGMGWMMDALKVDQMVVMTVD